MVSTSQIKEFIADDPGQLLAMMDALQKGKPRSRSLGGSFPRITCGPAIGFVVVLFLRLKNPSVPQ